MKDRGFNSFASSMIKLSVKETKWSSLLARTRALILYISIWIFDFGPEKLPGLSRNGPLGDFGVPSFRRHSAEPLHSTSVKYAGAIILAIALTIAALALGPWLRTPEKKKNTCRRGLIQWTYSSSQGAGHVSFIESRKQTSFTAHHDSLNT